MQLSTAYLMALLCIGALVPFAPASAVEDYNPVTTDNAAYDSDFPPTAAEVTIPSGDVAMNGLLYLAKGEGPHKTIMFLHGYPGNERNLDIAQAVRRAGFHALYFNYRGSWGTGGMFRWSGTVADAQAALRWLRSPETRERFRTDPEGISMIGHSIGGWAAFLAAAEDAGVACVGYLAGFNLGQAGALMAERDEMRQGYTDYFVSTNDPVSGPIRSAGGEALAKEIMDNADAYDISRVAASLADRSVLMASGAKDDVAVTAEHHDPVVAALRAAGASRVTEVIFENGDHSFSADRIALAEAVLRWLRSDC